MNQQFQAFGAPDRMARGSSGQVELVRLFLEHNSSLIQLLRAKLRSDQEARDVAQEAYVRLLQLDRLGAVSYLRTYLFRTALNIATDRLRSASVRAAAHSDPLFDPGVDEISPERAALAEDELRSVAVALTSLPPKPRYAFLLHRFADLDIDEVAERLGVTERMVRNYVLQALLRCRAARDTEALPEFRSRSSIPTEAPAMQRAAHSERWR